MRAEEKTISSWQASRKMQRKRAGGDRECNVGNGKSSPQSRKGCKGTQKKLFPLYKPLSFTL